MARKPTTNPPGTNQGGEATGEAATSDRDRIIDAFLAILAVRPIEEIGFSEIATRAEVSLGALRSEFGSKFAILAAHVKNVDRKVLDGHDADMADEPARERLFDVLMRRIEIMSPHKEAIRSLMRSARRDPCIALALNAMAVQSQQWMLTAADINASGPRGMLRAQGAAVLFAKVLQTFVHDEDPGHARTMAALDRELGRGERWIGFLDGLCRFSPSRCLSVFSRRRRRGGDDVADEPVVA